VRKLPEGWEIATLPAISELIMGQSPPSHTYNDSGVGLPFFQGKAEFGNFFPVPVKHCSEPIKCAEAGDILISVRAPVGPTNLCREKSCIGRGLAAIRPLQGVPSLYILFFLRSIEEWLSSQGTGSTFTAISKSDLEQIEILVPPLTEQRRIVAKLEPLLGSIDTYQQRLAKIPVTLKRFRQAVLAAACSGKLTADWREGHSNSYSAMEILKTIDAKELPESEWPDDTIPPTWVWTRFGDVISELKNGISLRPELQPPGIPILRISAARPGKVDLSDIRYLLNGEEFISVYKLKDRDLLFTRYNGSLDFLGVCGMVRGIGRQVILYPDKLMRVRFGHNLIEPEYAEIFFQTPAVHKRVIAKSKSSAGQNGVSGSDIKAQAFALPPHTEQQEIVRHVETLFKLVDQIEARYQRAKPMVDKMPQSILAKAFRGELVPTEAELARREGRDYEPASVLLERIKSERAEYAQGRKEKARSQMKPTKGKVSGVAISKS
jgi:type I restriction enzyme S subunit